MSDKKETVSGLRVILYGEPTVKTITIKNGSQAGQQKKVLECRAYHPNAERKEDGTFESRDSDWYSLKLYDDKADEVRKLLKDGLALRVCGRLIRRTYTDKSGAEKSAADIDLYNLAVDLLQAGLKKIDFAKPEKKEQKK